MGYTTTALPAPHIRRARCASTRAVFLHAEDSPRPSSAPRRAAPRPPPPTYRNTPSAQRCVPTLRIHASSAGVHPRCDIRIYAPRAWRRGEVDGNSATRAGSVIFGTPCADLCSSEVAGRRGLWCNARRQVVVQAWVYRVCTPLLAAPAPPLPGAHCLIVASFAGRRGSVECQRYPDPPCVRRGTYIRRCGSLRLPSDVCRPGSPPAADTQQCRHRPDQPRRAPAVEVCLPSFPMYRSTRPDAWLQYRILPHTQRAALLCAPHTVCPIPRGCRARRLVRALARRIPRRATPESALLHAR